MAPLSSVARRLARTRFGQRALPQPDRPGILKRKPTKRVFGGLTLFLGDEEFIKIEVSITNALCGAFLLSGLLFGQSFLKVAFSQALNMNDEGWRELTLRLGLFLIALGALNEVVRHLVSNDLWVAFRVYGILGLNGLFFLSQIPIIKRHMTEEAETPPE